MECVDSSSNTDVVATPTNKQGVKRFSDIDNVTDDADVESGSASITKPSKLVHVKIEPTDK